MSIIELLQAQRDRHRESRKGTLKPVAPDDFDGLLFRVEEHMDLLPNDWKIIAKAIKDEGLLVTEDEE